MNGIYDDDGDSIVLTDDDRQYIQSEIAAIDAQLGGGWQLYLIEETFCRLSTVLARCSTHRRPP